MPFALSVLALFGCARERPMDDTLPLLAQLRQQQLAENSQLQLQYLGEEITLPSDQEQLLHQFLAQKDPTRITLISGPSKQTNVLESARLASLRLNKLSQLLAPRAIELEPHYDPMQSPNQLLIKVLPPKTEDHISAQPETPPR
ncbi:hypothetical protein [Aeromonas cavernicola]|uniref:hypothetical protein n=1 Tax=Aeromonas cavernicola TaxID=1006623 RepID=UPI001F162204|nr:hypothetical protein [Aeromonas cavernicola]